jgi:hypothetical protein
MNGDSAQNIETQPTNTIIPEAAPQAEATPTPGGQETIDSIIQEGPAEQQQPVQQPQTAEAEQPNIVDMRTGNEKLDDVSPNADKTTEEANEVEDGFLEEVSSIHGSGQSNI